MTPFKCFRDTLWSTHKPGFNTMPSFRDRMASWIFRDEFGYFPATFLACSWGDATAGAKLLAQQESKIPSAWAAVLHGPAFKRLMQKYWNNIARNNMFWASQFRGAAGTWSIYVHLIWSNSQFTCPPCTSVDSPAAKPRRSRGREPLKKCRGDEVSGQRLRKDHERSVWMTKNVQSKRPLSHHVSVCMCMHGVLRAFKYKWQWVKVSNRSYYIGIAKITILGWL